VKLASTLKLVRRGASSQSAHRSYAYARVSQWQSLRKTGLWKVTPDSFRRITRARETIGIPYTTDARMRARITDPAIWHFGTTHKKVAGQSPKVRFPWPVRARCVTARARAE